MNVNDVIKNLNKIKKKEPDAELVLINFDQKNFLNINEMVLVYVPNNVNVLELTPNDGLVELCDYNKEIHKDYKPLVLCR